jgi:hypothetical protein
MLSSVILRDMIWIIVRREAEAMLTSIQPPKVPNGADANDQAIQGSANISVDDALRLPLSVAADPVNHLGVAAAFENSGPLPDETLRLNESPASLQWGKLSHHNTSFSFPCENTAGRILRSIPGKRAQCSPVRQRLPRRAI